MRNNDEIRFIRQRYKVITLLVYERKINNNNNKIQPQKNENKVEVIRTKYKS